MLLTLAMFTSPACGSFVATSPAASASPAAVSPSPWQSSSPSSSAAPAVTVITDSKYGYRFAYPASWTDVTAFVDTVAGNHAISSRADLVNPTNLTARDLYLVVVVGPPHAVVGCSEPVTFIEKTPTTLDGASGTLYVRNGAQVAQNEWVLDVIALRSDVCYQLQLQAGAGTTEADAKAVLSRIQDSFRFGQ